ncbi:NADPH-dependent curcumin reductase CurA [Mycobacterium frederiksbergense]|uniref:NADPH-dependent curcumin reductase CurA n=1 Tax=Mycolicibacterium frederiksbergense TaxID=117567 RepID=A0ABT6KW01_9MYCO|nr:NADPH-dependent curcumin reductase CurA [Mycolicibacterium frederiksbergense]
MTTSDALWCTAASCPTLPAGIRVHIPPQGTDTALNVTCMQGRRSRHAGQAMAMFAVTNIDDMVVLAVAGGLVGSVACQVANKPAL